MNNKILEKALNRQVKYAAWYLAMHISIMLLGIIFIFTGLDPKSIGVIHLAADVIFFGEIALIAACTIAFFILWILAIVNAVKINSITNDSIILIIFSVFTFLFVLLIIAVMERTKYRELNPEDSFISNQSSNGNYSFEDKLKNSFTNGIITSQEYEEKLADHKKNNPNS